MGFVIRIPDLHPWESTIHASTLDFSSTYENRDKKYLQCTKTYIKGLS